MNLKSIKIKNYRGIKELALELDPGTTVLIGENNSGKTSVLRAIDACLSYKRKDIFSEYDFHLDSAEGDFSNVESIEITLVFAEHSPNEWGEDATQKLSSVWFEDQQGCKSIALQLEGQLKKQTGVIHETNRFLDEQGKARPLSESDLYRFKSYLRRCAQPFYLKAFKNVEQAFSARSSHAPYWSSFLRSTPLDESKKQELEQELSKINQKVVQSHKPFEKIQRELERMKDILMFKKGSVVDVEAVPQKIFDLLRAARLKIQNQAGVQLPLASHGEGMQNLAVWFLFCAFLKAQKDDWKEITGALVLLEEPEAHLHPAAVKNMYLSVKDVSAQKIISTHSGDLLSEVDVQYIRRLYVGEGQKIKVGCVHVDELQNITRKYDVLERFNYHIRRTNAHLLFAKVWILAEGQTDVMLVDEAARLMGVDFNALGICCVPFQHADVALFCHAAKRLGIRLVLFAEGDLNGQKSLKSFNKITGGERPYFEAVELVKGETLETYLEHNGFDDVYTAPRGHQYTSKEKVSLMHTVLSCLQDDKKNNQLQMPEKLQKIIEISQKMAQNEI